MLEILNSTISINKNKFNNFEAYSVVKDSMATKYGSVNSDLPFTVNYLYRLIISRQDLRPVAVLIKLHSLTRVTNAIDITPVDNITNDLRFNVSYHLQSTTTNTRYILTTRSSESTPVLSLQSLYPAFNWTERETWDMFGIFFAKHPDLRRILTDYGFVGFPLRKDFPLTGFREVQFEDTIKQVEYNNAELTQSYRLLSFNRSWSING